MKAPKAPKPTAQELAVERRQQAALDEEIREQEERIKAMARGKLGAKSLLGGVPRTRQASATGGRTMLGGSPAVGAPPAPPAYGGGPRPTPRPRTRVPMR